MKFQINPNTGEKLPPDAVLPRKLDPGETPPATPADMVEEALQAQQNVAYEPPAGMRLDTRTNELVEVKGWSFPEDAAPTFEPPTEPATEVEPPVE